MNKKYKGGLLAALAGVAAGAAAVFLSKKENREMVAKEVKKAKTVAADVRKNPKKYVNKAKTAANKVAKKAVKAEKAVVSKVKKVALKPVGKKTAKKKTSK